MYKIYQTKIAPNARRLRLFLAEKGVADVTFVTVNLLEGENLTPEFRAKNPFGRIPVLEFEDGSFLAESVAISRYFEEIVPEPPLFGLDPLDKAHVEMWNRRAEFGFMQPAGFAFRNISGAFKDREVCNADYGQVMAANANKGLALLDERLGVSEFLAGPRYSIADCTLTAAFDFFHGTKVVTPEDILDQLPNLKRWHAAMAARANYRA